MIWTKLLFYVFVCPMWERLGAVMTSWLSKWDGLEQTKEMIVPSSDLGPWLQLDIAWSAKLFLRHIDGQPTSPSSIWWPTPLIFFFWGTLFLRKLYLKTSIFKTRTLNVHKLSYPLGVYLAWTRIYIYMCVFSLLYAYTIAINSRSYKLYPSNFTVYI